MNNLLAALRAAGETTRLRILAALEGSELTVSELVYVLDQSQPRVSRHLKLLCDSGMLQRFQEGAWVFHRISDAGKPAKLAQAIIDMIDKSDSTIYQDQQRLHEVKSINAERAATYFNKNASDWDSIRKLAVPDTDVESRLIKLVSRLNPELFLDLGTGTGRMLEILSRHFNKGIGIDSSREMLIVARSNLHAAKIANCTVRNGDINQLNMPPNSVNFVIIHQVLHYLEKPENVIYEAARVLKPNGQLVIVDFLPHNMETLREKHAHRRLGFSNETIKQWSNQRHMQITNFEVLNDNQNSTESSLEIGLWTVRNGLH